MVGDYHVKRQNITNGKFHLGQTQLYSLDATESVIPEMELGKKCCSVSSKTHYLPRKQLLAFRHLLSKQK